MSSLTSGSRWLLIAGMAGLLALQAFGQSAYAPQAGEYAIAGALAGDQMGPQVSINAFGGYVVWQDNATDGDGLGISARRLVDNLSGLHAAVRVNLGAAGNQDSPQVAMLADGGAAFVWHSSKGRTESICARILKADRTFATADVTVGASTEGQLSSPAIARISDGSLVIVWSDFGRDGSMQGVFAQRLSAQGTKLGDDFQANQYTSYNQRTPVVTGLAHGGFVIAWASEQQNRDGGVDVYARLYSAGAAPIGGEFRVNAGELLCANPALCATADGGFVVAWSQFSGRVEVDGAVQSHAWDVVVRGFGADGVAKRAPAVINTYRRDNQFGPRLAMAGSDCLVVWTSLGQDGSREGVFGQLVTQAGAGIGEEFRANTTTASQQIRPALASDGEKRFLVIWSSFVGSNGFDLFGQRYASEQPLPAPPAPFVAALSQSKLSVTWPELAGYSLAAYELYADESEQPGDVTTNLRVVSGLASGSEHTFRLAYRLPDGRRSPLSDVAVGRTWLDDESGDGLPDDWQAIYWGAESSGWRDSREDVDGDGATNLEEFWAGTNPVDATSALRMEIVSAPQGPRLTWTAQRGFVYQVQVSTNVTKNAIWEDVGSPRFATDDQDSIPVDGSKGLAYFRVIRLR